MDVNLLLPVIFIPAGAGLLILLLPERVKVVQEVISFIAGSIMLAGTIYSFFFHTLPVPAPFNEVFRSTSFSSFLLMIAAGFGFFITLYSISYMWKKERRRQFYAFLLLALAGTAGVLLSDHILAFLISWETVTLALYFLIIGGEQGAQKGATKSFIMLGATDGLLLFGLALLWQISGKVLFSEMHISTNTWISGLSFTALMISAITKAGAMPFHTWIPASSEAAHPPAMAVLPASLDKVLGIFFLFTLCNRIFVIGEGFQIALLVIGCITIIGAVLIAMVQHDLRKLLAYHTVSQVGYMIVGIGTLSPLGILGGLFHMINNSIYKSCLFLGSGAVGKKTGTFELGKLGGLAKAMPFTFIAFLIAALSISGIPPFNGFVSKWMIYQALLESVKSGTLSMNIIGTIVFIVAMFGSALTLASFIKALYSVFLGQKTEKTQTVLKEVSFAMWIPMMTLASVCVLLGVFYLFFIRNILGPITGLTPVFPGVWESSFAMVLIFTGFIIGLLIYLAGKIVRSSRVVEPYIGGEQENPEVHRVPGTDFYTVISNMPVLRNIYKGQAKEYLDPFEWFGKLGDWIIMIFKKIQNGLLPWYLSLSLIGLVISLVLFLSFFITF
ncbi:MAG: hypothetical protein JXB88_11280 [Spirochaetales bacterium]|nr:hypothetical protein [Spirochaetales bacterium]